ncbi:MAG: DNA polymerase III subunit delta [Chitinophagaceae bacterium]|nr:DNA polymerase III subunit delta [Chitinophagaceae bacterium]
MLQNYESIIQDCKKNKFENLYWLQAEEPYFIDFIASLIEKIAIPEEYKYTNQTILYGKEVKMIEILERAKSFPMMGEKKLLLIKEAQEISDFGTEKADGYFEKYLNNPNTQTILVFCYKYKTLDKRKNITKLIEKKMTVLDEKKIYEDQLPLWIRKIAQEQNLKITDKATHILAENIGINLTRIDNELAKIRVNIPSNIPINETHIQEYVGINKDFNEFELQKAIAQKNHLKANQIINYLSDDLKNHSLIMLTALLFSFFCKMMLCHYNRKNGDQELAKIMGISPYFLAEYKAACNRYSFEKIIQNIDVLHKTDIKMKGISGGTADEREMMKELVYKLMND